MAVEIKNMWLKAFLTLIISLMLMGFTTGSAWMSTKVDKNIFNQHKEHDIERFEYIKDSLDRIEGNQK